MFTYHWRLATIMLLSIPLYVLVYVVVNRLNKQVERKVMEDSAVLQSQLVESLNAMKTVKQFGVEGFQKNKTDNAFDRLLKSVYRSMKNVLFSGKSTEVISRVFYHYSDLGRGIFCN